MKNFERVSFLDERFADTHKVRPRVFRHRESADEYTVKLEKGDKTAEITEIMHRGLTKQIILKTDKEESMKSFYEAEVKAAKYLSEEKPLDEPEEVDGRRK